MKTKTTPVIEITDYNYNNTGQQAIFYRKAKQTTNGYQHDVMAKEFHQLTPELQIVGHTYLGLD